MIFFRLPGFAVAKVPKLFLIMILRSSSAFIVIKNKRESSRLGKTRNTWLSTKSTKHWTFDYYRFTIINDGMFGKYFGYRCVFINLMTYTQSLVYI